MVSAIEIEIPGWRVPSLNETLREHYGVRTRRVNFENALLTCKLNLELRPRPVPPILVTLTRVGPGKLDGHDNLCGGFKSIVDCIARWFGLDDGDTRRVRWQYAQLRAKDWATRMRFESMEVA